MILKLPLSEAEMRASGSSGAVSVNPKPQRNELGQIVQMRGSANHDETELRPEECVRFAEVFLKPPAPPAALVEAFRRLK